MINTAERQDRLAPDEAAAVLDLAKAAADTDGAYPMSEHVVLHLNHDDTPSVHLLVREDAGGLLGYAHVDATDPIDGPAAELVVHPQHRRRGIGGLLATAAVEAAEDADVAGRLRLWAHGDHPSASALALSLGFMRSRTLWQMRRSLHVQVPQPNLPAGVSLRTFQPGRDDEAWLACNAEAFADHPEQGRWTLRDLRLRMSEAWFDPDGFLLAERADGTLAGFHWTKVHGRLPGAGPQSQPEHHRHDPIGEVYVLGVDPAMQGTGLGRALTAAGLRYLHAKGLNRVMLYVDESNRPAATLYTSLGFARWSTDVLYARGGEGSTTS